MTAKNKYTKEDLLILKDKLSKHLTLESARFVWKVLEFDEYTENTKNKDIIWVRNKINRLEMYPFIMDFLDMPFIRIPLVINRYGKGGIAFLVMTWRLEIGK